MKVPTYFLFSLLFLAGACRNDNTDPDLNVNISDEFEILMKETLSTQSRTFNLQVQTLDNLDCMNYTIAHSLNQNNGTIQFSINNIVDPVDCIVGNAPAKTTINLETMANGVYNIEINLRENEIVNKGQLIIDEYQFILSTESDYGISFPYTTLRRVPENAVWGYLEFDDLSNYENVLENFHLLLSLMTTTAYPLNGEYGYFRISNNEITTVYDDGRKIDNNLFYYQNIDDIDDLTSALQAFRDQYPEVSFHVLLSNGNRL